MQEGYRRSVFITMLHDMNSSVICVLKYDSPGSGSQSSSKHIPMQPNRAYETVTRAQQSAATGSQN